MRAPLPQPQAGLVFHENPILGYGVDRAITVRRSGAVAGFITSTADGPWWWRSNDPDATDRVRCQTLGEAVDYAVLASA